jgi:septum formation protein
MMGKPDGRRDAVRMLRALSGRTHSVVTGIALVERPSGRQMTGTERTDVTFRDLPLSEIEEYVSGGSPLDKAGAYGIQDDYGAVFVTRIEGCFYNVVGLPLSRLHTALREFQADGSMKEEGG